jgi:hypothetical protein
MKGSLQFDTCSSFDTVAGLKDERFHVLRLVTSYENILGPKGQCPIPEMKFAMHDQNRYSQLFDSRNGRWIGFSMPRNSACSKSSSVFICSGGFRADSPQALYQSLRDTRTASFVKYFCVSSEPFRTGTSKPRTRACAFNLV